MVDHRPPSYGLQAPWLNRGPATAALTGHFFFNPLPAFSPRPTTCSDEVITEDSFSPGKISPGLRRLILLLYPEHIKNLPPSNGIICMKGNCPTIYLQLCHSIFSQGHAHMGKKERNKKRRGILVKADEAKYHPLKHCPFSVRLRDTVCGQLLSNIITPFIDIKVILSMVHQRVNDGLIVLHFLEPKKNTTFL